MVYENLDFYSLKAHKEGYPARSVYKLQELHKKFGVLKQGGHHLDIGSNPGSWFLYILQFLKGKGLVVGCDLVMPNLPNCPPNAYLFQGDIFEESTENQIRQKGPYDVILSDAAPATTGNRIVDTGRSFQLCQHVLLLAQNSLKQGGNLVMKLFQGGEEQSFKTILKELFLKVSTCRPVAVRQRSCEIYLVGLGKKSSTVKNHDM